MQEGLGYACQYETCQTCLWLRRCFKLVTGPVAVSSLVMKSKSQSNGGSRSRKMRVRAAEAQEVYIDGASLSPFVACSSCSSLSPPSMESPARCSNAEGWGPISTTRPFDFTPCFEEGILLSTLLVFFVVAAAFRCWALRSKESSPRCRRSVWVLRSKLVR